MLEGVEDEILEKFLVADPDLDGLAGRAVLPVPALHQRNVQSSPGPAGPEMERSGSPEESYAISRVVRVEGTLLQEWHTILRQLKLLLVLIEASGLQGLLGVPVRDR